MYKIWGPSAGKLSDDQHWNAASVFIEAVRRLPLLAPGSSSSAKKQLQCKMSMSRGGLVPAVRINGRGLDFWPVKARKIRPARYAKAST
jgi:hypothetical protein